MAAIPLRTRRTIMSKKTSTKAKSTKAAKAVPAKKRKRPAKVAEATATEVQQPIAQTGTCPKGGDHEWSEENGEQYCGKCKEPKEAKAPRSIVAKTAGEKKVSAIDAAAQLLAEAAAPMNCVEMIEAMASKGLWQSPGGKTPHATLYSAIIREIGLKGEAARFVKAERGRFTIKA
jgi:hypothetical protein